MLALLTKLFGKKFVQSIMGTRTNVQVLKTAKNNPFTNNFSKQALKDDPQMLADAESVMQKHAGFALSNQNTGESAQFLKNLKTLDEIKNPEKAKVYEFETKKKAPKKVQEGIEKVRGGEPDTLQGNVNSLKALLDEMRGITPAMRVAKNRQELADFIRKMRGKKFSNEEIQMVKDYADMYSMNLAKEKLAPAIVKTKQMGGKGKTQIELTEDYMDTLKTRNQDDFKEFYTVGQTNHQIREAMIKDLRAQGLTDDVIQQVDDELYRLSHDQTGSAFDRVTTASHPANWVKRAGDEIEMITGTKMDTKFYENWGHEVLSKYQGKPEFASGGIARVGMLMGGFTKAEVLIQMLKNTLKGSKDAYVKKNFPNFIKELKANPELALDPNVWKQFTTGLPKNQRLVVHSDDSVDFFRQTEFGPHNIENITAFQKKHPFLTREQATEITKMEPEDQVLEVTRQEKIYDQNLIQKNKDRIQRLREKGFFDKAEGGRVSYTKGGLAHVLGV